MDEARPIWQWGSGTLPPSVERVDARSWLVASIGLGAAAGAAALTLSWRPIFGFEPPPGALSQHALHWLGMACHAASHGLCAASAAEYADYWARLPDPGRLALVHRCAFAIWAALMPAVLLAPSTLLPRDGLIHVRGARRHVGADAVARLRAALAPGVARGSDHEFAPGVPYPAEMWTRGTLIVASVGGGKSTCLRALIDKVVKSGEQMLLFDAKSEFTAGWEGPAILAPWDARSLAWDIAKDARNVLEMERFAEAMVRESADPMWSSASRQVLVGLMLRLRGERGEDWGWADLAGLLSIPQPILLATLDEWHPVAARSLAKASVTSAGILINLGAYCAPVFHFAAAWGAHPPARRISLVEWTLGKSKHRQLILQGHGAYRELARALAEGVLGVYGALVASVEMPDSRTRKLWFIADECAQLGRFPTEILALGRSRGSRSVLAMQDFAQLEASLGAPAVKALAGMVGALVVGQQMPGESAELLCKAFGTREVERPHVSPAHGPSSNQSGAVSYSREEVPLYKPSELASRLGLSNDGKSVKMIVFTAGAAYELSWPLFPMAQARPAHLLAPWLRVERSQVGLSMTRDEAVARDKAARSAQAARAAPSREAAEGAERAKRAVDRPDSAGEAATGAPAVEPRERPTEDETARVEDGAPLPSDDASFGDEVGLGATESDGASRGSGAGDEWPFGDAPAGGSDAGGDPLPGSSTGRNAAARTRRGGGLRL